MRVKAAPADTGGATQHVRRSAMGLETVEIVMDLEDWFQIHISDSAASACITVGDTQQLIVDLLKEQHRATPDVQREVWDGMMAVLRRNGYSVESIRPGSKWIGDITCCG